MKVRVIGMLILGSAPSHAQPKLLASAKRPGVTPERPSQPHLETAVPRPEVTRPRPASRPFDPKLSRDSALVVPHEPEWQVAPWANVQLERPTKPDRPKVQICPANMSGGRGIKIKIPI